MTIRHKHYVWETNWAALQKRASDFSDREVGRLIPALAAAYNGLLRVADVAVERATATARDQNLSDMGRRAQMKGWLKDVGGPAMRDARIALAAAKEERQSVRQRMTGLAADKTDVAGALQRWEAREFLRSLPDAKRNALFYAPNIEPIYAKAVAEMPAEFSGVAPQLKARIEDQLMIEAHPEAVEKLEVLDEMLRAVESAAVMAGKTMRQQAAATTEELNAAAGEPSFLERTEARLAEAFPPATKDQPDDTDLNEQEAALEEEPA